MNKKIIGLIASLTFTLACGIIPSAQAPQPPQGGVETIVAQTLTALTAAAPAATAAPSTEEPPAPDGTPFQTAEVSLFIPNGVANGASSFLTTTIEFPFINPSVGEMPQHIAVTFTQYGAQSQLDPRIMIFRADEYQAFIAPTPLQMDAMRSYTDGQPLPGESSPTFFARPHALQFANGRGIRYITQVIQGVVPINNSYLFYFYQGITDDGKYFVEALLPLSSIYLAANGDPDAPLPAEGIPFNFNDFAAYYNLISEKINAADSSSFSPYLESLDELIASMQINGF
ncbi:MAG: hypothetical protein LC099_05885 [Anaerolineales bacterium]|nr:hypothetical protein [Anaerolineales bacterium]